MEDKTNSWIWIALAVIHFALAYISDRPDLVTNGWIILVGSIVMARPRG